MDVYGMNIGAGPMGLGGDRLAAGGIPMRVGADLMADGALRQGYDGLSETQKEHLLMRCRDAQSRDEMQRIVDELAPGADITAILAEERERNARRGLKTSRRLW